MLIHWDKRRTLIILPEAQLISFVAMQFFHICKQAINERKKACIALSGGSTPKELYEYLAKASSKEDIDWNLVHLFWADERAVPQSHPDNNYKMSMEAGLSHLPIPKANIHPMQADTDIESHAKAYDNLLKATCGEGLDLILLGIGEDGHTASLFPNTKAINIENCWAAANEVPQKQTYRMTLTFPCINKARNIIILVKGSSKAEIVKELFSLDDEKYPASYVGTLQSKALFALDEKAASLLIEGLKKQK